MLSIFFGILGPIIALISCFVCFLLTSFVYFVIVMEGFSPTMLKGLPPFWWSWLVLKIARALCLTNIPINPTTDDYFCDRIWLSSLVAYLRPLLMTTSMWWPSPCELSLMAIFSGQFWQSPMLATYVTTPTIFGWPSLEIILCQTLAKTIFSKSNFANPRLH